MIVEDEFLIASFLEQIVCEFGCHVIGTAKSADEALKLLQSHPVDIVLMDINLEGATDGIQCAILMNRIAPIPIIYTTALGDTQTILDTSDTNVYGYLIKPFDKQDIEAALTVAISRIKQSAKQASIQPPSGMLHLGRGYIYKIEERAALLSEIW